MIALSAAIVSACADEPVIDAAPSDAGVLIDARAMLDARVPDDDAGEPPVACDVVASDGETLERAIAAASPGDTVCLAAGTWRDLVLRITQHGAEGAPITIAAERPGETIVTGTSAIGLGGSHLVLRGLVFRGGRSAGGTLLATRSDVSTPCGHCRLTELTIDGVDEGVEESKWVSIYGDHNRVDHSWFAHKTSSDVLLVVWRPDGAEDHHRIDHNYFGDRPPVGEGAETLRVGTSDTHDTPSYTIVEHNLFERTSGEIEIVSNKSGRNVYRHNTFRASIGQLTLRHGDGCVVEGNWFFADGAPGAGGIRVVGGGHRIVNNYVQGVRTSSDVRGGIVLMSWESDAEPTGYQEVVDVLVAHNTIADSEQSLVLGAGSSDRAPRRITLANNLIGGAIGAVVRSELGIEASTWAGNVLHGDALGLDETPGIRFVDPGLARDGEGIWRPDPRGPAIDTAAAIDEPLAIDIEGHRRDGRADVGADELVDAPARLPPLTAADVGPRTYDPRRRD
ncbi:Alginate lyase precursor [Sandaracinus amylolyticus]|uniref:Alginate lyase n=1 Tax=Sandaracinus amylolyticus TaxID=927083 RepID=A0A0F6YLE0_9BACT|nr:Alginate lyase precursor [Sandaracinus amylolyticus]